MHWSRNPTIFSERLIIGSDRRSETKQGKIVRFRSCLRHFRFIISCHRHFVTFVLNFIHVIPKKGHPPKSGPKLFYYC